MDWLNYNHLQYFHTVVREGGLAPAARKLRLTHPTISAQVRALEEQLGEQLLVKQGRRLHRVACSWLHPSDAFYFPDFTAGVIH